MSEIKRDFRKDVTKRLSGMAVYRELPETGLDAEQVAQEIERHLTLGKRFY